MKLGASGEMEGSIQDVPILSVRVECYAGYQGEESPQRFFLGQRKVEVIDILDRWLAPDHRYIKVDGQVESFHRHKTAVKASGLSRRMAFR